MSLIIHVLIRNNDNVRPLDSARYYTMTRERGDITGARALLDSDANWLSLACRDQVVNKSVAAHTATPDACVTERLALRNGILDKMKCFAYSSQVCSYLRNVTAALIQTRTYGGASTYVGKKLSGTVTITQGTLTYNRLLQSAVDNAPFLFHNAYRAVQNDDFYVLRTILYGLVVWSIFANLVVHYFDEMQDISWSNRLIMRIAVFSITVLVISLSFLINNMGSSLTVLAGIWAPSFVVLVYFEAFLDASITRPW